MTLEEILQEARPGPTFRLSAVYVLGPYPTRQFFEQVVSQSPSRVVLAVDDGWPQTHVDEIGDMLNASRTGHEFIRVAPAESNALVHAKAYLFEWTNEGATKVKRRLVVGSANASSQGFGVNGRGHAETYVIFELTGADARCAFAYFDRLTTCANNSTVPGVWIGGAPARVWLPALKRTDARPASFSAWLRRGRLCHRYEREQSFGKLQLTLKKRLPPGPLDRAFDSAGLTPQGNGTVLNAAYLADADEPGAESEPRWRGTYFVETAYGHWTSEECFHDRHEAFVGQGHEQRKSTLNRIAGMSAEDEEGFVNAFLQRLDRAATAIRAEGESPEQYLNYRNGAIDALSYRRRAISKLQQDRQLANDLGYANRFVSGYTFPPVPPLDSDFLDFACGFCDSIQLKLARPRNRNKVARVLFAALEREAPGKFDAAQSPDNLFHLIERVWPAVGTEVRLFHEAADQIRLLS